MMRSTKYFTDVPASTYNKTCPNFKSADLSKSYGQIKMVISDTDCATSYLLDPTIGGGPINALISYTWGDEASNESTQLHDLTSVAGSNKNRRAMGLKVVLI
jgi:hypothetical protein